MSVPPTEASYTTWDARCRCGAFERNHIRGDAHPIASEVRRNILTILDTGTANHAPSAQELEGTERRCYSRLILTRGP